MLPKTLAADWAALFASDHNSVAVFDHSVLFPLQRKTELYMMLAAVGEPRVVMEIGADKGGGLYHWCALPSVERVIACEIRGTPYRDAFEAAFPHIDFLWLPVPSREESTIVAVEAWLGDDTIDVLFLDGEKAHFYEDLVAYLSYVAGYVLFHDIRDEATGQAWRRAVGDKAEIVCTVDWFTAPQTEHGAWLREWKGQSCGVGVLRTT